MRQTQDQIVAFSAKTKIQRDIVESYIKIRRRNATIGRKVDKFVEALWRFLFYGAFTILGYHCLFVPTTADWINGKMHANALFLTVSRIRFSSYFNYCDV
jgi:hypothetical protein